MALERQTGDPGKERARHSVFDEPAIWPNRPSILIDRDWSCRNCGYNLRGLMTGHPCPECGQVELYEPPREGEQTYAQWLAEHEAQVSLKRSWLVAALVPVAGLPFAFLSAFVTVEYAAALFFVGIGPIMAEILKVAIALTIVERRSFLIRRPGQLYLMTLGTALIFAVVQNWVYLEIYFKSSPIELVAYRWTASIALHMVCTLIATRGLSPVWEQAQGERRLPTFTVAYPTITAAIVLHATYNAYIFLKGATGYGF